MANHDSKYALLPVYLVLDTSYSMQEDDRFNAALTFLPKLLSSIRYNNCIHLTGYLPNAGKLAWS